MDVVSRLSQLLEANEIVFSYEPTNEHPVAELHNELGFGILEGFPLKVTLTKGRQMFTTYIVQKHDLEKPDDIAVLFHIIFDALSIMGEDFDTWLSQIESKHPINDRVKAHALFDIMAAETRALIEFLGMETFIEFTVLLVPSITEYAHAA